MTKLSEIQITISMAELMAIKDGIIHAENKLRGVTIGQAGVHCKEILESFNALEKLRNSINFRILENTP